MDRVTDTEEISWIRKMEIAIFYGRQVLVTYILAFYVLCMWVLLYIENKICGRNVLIISTHLCSFTILE
jgi:hypothetical protein